jgi:DNA-binding HxlR family transcriptional regulator
MPARKNLEYLDCSVANALDIIGDRWSLLILRDAFMGVRRFDNWQRDLGIARNILAQRLDRLVEAEVLAPNRYQDNPPRDEYLLTAKGKDLLDVLLTLWRWGDRWAPPPEAAHRDLIHLECGRAGVGDHDSAGECERLDPLLNIGKLAPGVAGVGSSCGFNEQNVRLTNKKSSPNPSRSPARVGGPSAVVLIPVIALVDYQSIFVKTQNGCARERDLLAVLDPTRPPLDRGPIGAGYRFTEPALDVFFLVESPRQVVARSCDALVRFAKRIRQIPGMVGIKSSNRVDVSCGPCACPDIGPSTSRFLGAHTS